MAHGVAGVVRLVAGSGHPWKKKKKQRPAKEKGSSRLELLEWLRRKLLPWLPLEGKELLGKVVAAASAVADAAEVIMTEKGAFYRGEREKWCNHHVRWFDGYWR